MEPCFSMTNRRRSWLSGVIGLALFVHGAVSVFGTNSTHWAFQTLVRPQVPKSVHPNAIDAFVASALVRNGRTLAPEADRRTLIRRLSFDLLGLPPAPEEVTRFLNDKRPDAYERLVEAFLSSPQYGERWGRHWLDLTGYAD